MHSLALMKKKKPNSILIVSLQSILLQLKDNACFKKKKKEVSCSFKT